MKTLLALFIALVVAGCGQQAMPELPEGVTCNDSGRETVLSEGLPAKADVTSDEYSTAFAVGYFNVIGCDMALPDLEDF